MSDSDSTFFSGITSPYDRTRAVPHSDLRSLPAQRQAVGLSNGTDLITLP